MVTSSGNNTIVAIMLNMQQYLSGAMFYGRSEATYICQIFKYVLEFFLRFLMIRCQIVLLVVLLVNPLRGERPTSISWSVEPAGLCRPRRSSFDTQL